jgi:glutamyl-tRNA synthetase
MEKVQKAGAKFNPDKAKWFNKEYLRMKSDEELAKLFVPVLAEHGVEDDFEHLVKVVHLIKERATFVADFWDIAWYLFKAPETYAEKDVAKFWKPENVEPALKVAEFIAAYEGEWNKESLETALEEFIRSNEWPMGKVMNAIRLALAGSASGLGIADIVARIGKKDTAARLESAVSALGN